MRDKIKKKKSVSIVCAVHNEEKTVLLFYDRIKPIIKSLQHRYNFELIFTNNRSTDNTYNLILGLMKTDPIVKILTFSRNFGYQASVQAGMTYADGDCIITIDVDCEDPPELIPQFLQKWEEGFDVVYGRRMNRPESKFMVSIRKLFYKVLRYTADTNIILDMAEFGLISSHVRDIIIQHKNSFPFLRTEIAYCGFETYGIKYDRQQRIAGDTHYNLWGMLLFAVRGIMSSSTYPLRMTIFLFPCLVIYNIIMLYFEIYQNSNYFKILIVTDILYMSLILAVQCTYIARIYINGMGRPLYIVDWSRSSDLLRVQPPLKK